jgi:hypothetical protein
MITAQDKILHVANKLGLTSLQNMQASTGAVYDADLEISGQIFNQASKHQAPAFTNISENQFEVNEALLVENVSFYCTTSPFGRTNNFQTIYGSNNVIVFDLYIANKRVLKDVPVFAAGSPYTFASVGQSVTTAGAVVTEAYQPRHQVFMEGAGILIPPQVQWYVQYKVYDVVTGAVVDTTSNPIGCYLFGTKVLLNFNTSI